MSVEDHRQFEEVSVIREREWLIPCTIMTLMLGAAAVALMPVAGYDHVPPYFGRFLSWLLFCFFGTLFLAAGKVFNMWRSGVKDPIAHMKAHIRSYGATTAVALAGIILAGIDIMLFMWIKPEVTALSPFWADDLYADIDHALFLGHDPWRLFKGIDLTFHAWTYSFFWALAIMGTIVWLAFQKPSRERSVSLLSYFALWSIFGPIGQFLGSAAGPVFYRRIGLGDRFVELESSLPEATQFVSGYLWQHHITGEPAVGAGIAAMPSLHVATVAWVFLTFRALKSPMAPVAAVFAIYIYGLSIALGWHYAIDGIVGVGGALACQWLWTAWLKRKEKATFAIDPVVAQ